MPDFIIQLCALVRIATLSVRCEVQKYGNELKNDFLWKRGTFFSKKRLAMPEIVCYAAAAHSICRCSSGVEQRIRNAWVVSSNLTSGFSLRNTRCRVLTDKVPP